MRSRKTNEKLMTQLQLLDMGSFTKSRLNMPKKFERNHYGRICVILFILVHWPA
jgi:hypothetical protein